MLSSLAGPFNVCKPLKPLKSTYCGVTGVGQKDVVLKNKAEKLLKTQDRASKTSRNKPENKAEKLLKIRACGKN